MNGGLGGSASAAAYRDREQQTVEEALLRGGSERLVVDWLVWERRKALRQPLYPLPLWPPKEGSLEAAVQRLVRPQLESYRQKITSEVGSLPSGFKDPDLKRTPRELYFVMRPLYYVLGFDNPVKDILQKIVDPFLFLGKKVPGGVNQTFVRGLNRVAGILEKISTGLSARVASAIRKQDGGLVPRFIEDTTTLSNHAFGLAIDIDPLTNPYIKDKTAIAALNEIVRMRTGREFDFSVGYAEGNWDRLLTEAQKTTMTWAYAQFASNAVRDFLSENLETYKLCRKEIAAGAGPAAGAAAAAAAKQAQMAIDNEADLKLIKKLNVDCKIEMATLEAWERYGIQTIPLELVLALKEAFAGNEFFRWGQEYHKLKDGMHFELEAFRQLGGGQLNSRKFRSLEELFPPVFWAFYSPNIDAILAGRDFVTGVPPLRGPR